MALALQPSPPTLSPRPPAAHHTAEQPPRDLHLGVGPLRVLDPTAHWRSVAEDELIAALGDARLPGGASDAAPPPTFPLADEPQLAAAREAAIAAEHEPRDARFGLEAV